MTDDLRPVLKSVDAGMLDEEEQALAHYSELVRAGADAGQALNSASVRFPDQAGLLADYALYVSSLARDGVNEAEIGPLEAMIEAVAASKVPLDKEAFAHGLLRRIGSIGLTLDDVCARLRIARSILTKLDRRLIVPSTIPDRFARELARIAMAPVDALKEYLALAPGLSAASEYKASRTPRAGSRQTFSQALDAAVVSGELSAAERKFWRDGDST